ncbi:MAG: hypothetical protein ACLGJB_25165 [Blastocatellia bacterium]
MKETNNKRTLAAQPFSFNAYEDNYGAVMSLCEASGRKPAEELRDLLDEGIRSRKKRSGEGPESATGTIEQLTQREGEITQLVQLIQQLIQKTTLHNDLILRIALHLREQYGMVLESVAAGYAARHLIWKYVVEAILRDEGLSPEQIMLRLDEERRTWNAERDQAADLIEQAIRNLRSGQENGSASI